MRFKPFAMNSLRSSGDCGLASRRALAARREPEVSSGYSAVWVLAFFIVLAVDSPSIFLPEKSNGDNVLPAAHFCVNTSAGCSVTPASFKPIKLAFFIAKSGFLGHFTQVLKEVCFL